MEPVPSVSLGGMRECDPVMMMMIVCLCFRVQDVTLLLNRSFFDYHVSSMYLRSEARARLFGER